MSEQGSKFYGWFLVGIFFCIYFINTTFPYYGASVINTFMAKALNLDRSTLGLGYSIFSVSLAVSAPVVGFCVNKFGTRLTLFGGGILIFLGALLMASAVATPWQYVVAFGLITGTGVSMGGAIPIQAGVTLWFKQRKAFAMSIVLSAAGVGGLIAAPLLNKIILASDGNWKIGWVLVAATAILSALLSVFFVKNRPEDMGQVPDGIPATTTHNAPSDSSSPVSQKTFQSNVAWGTGDAFRTKALWLIIFASIAYLTPYITVVAHGVVYLQEIGHPKAISAMSVGLLVFFSIIGRFASGFFGDRIEPRIIWSIALLFIVAGMVVLTKSAAMGPVSVYLYAFLVGTGMGGAYVCMATILGNYYGADSFASLMGLIFPIIFLVAALGPYLTGLVYDLRGSYVEAFIGLTVLAFVGVIGGLLATPPVVKQA